MERIKNKRLAVLEEITISRKAASAALSILQGWLAKASADDTLRQKVSEVAQAIGWADRIIIDYNAT